jgi:hypothetical protein
MSKVVSKIIGQPIQEAWESCDLANMVLGAMGDDKEKLKKGLMCLSKGQLKKVYTEISGKTVAAEPNDDAGEDTEEGGEEKVVDQLPPEAKDAAEEPSETEEQE